MRLIAGSKSVPLYYRQQGDVITLCDWHLATFLLYDILSGIALDGPFHYHTGVTTVRVEAIYFHKIGCTALYVANTVPLLTLGKDAMLRISRIHHGPDLFPYGPITETQIVDHLFYITKESRKDTIATRFKTLERWFNGQESPPCPKVSATHLRHISIHELRKLGLGYFSGKVRYILPFLEHMAKRGMHEAMLCGILVWACALREDLHLLSSRSGIWKRKYKDVDDFINVIKTSFSTRLKAVQNLLQVDVSSFFELEVLVNRGVGNVNWEQELLHRTRPTLAEVPIPVVKDIAISMFRTCRALGAKPNRYRWHNYWEDRWRWAPTGSYHSQYQEDIAVVPKDLGLKNKFYCLNATPRKTALFYLNREPAMVSWASTKYEWGKQRAIYGVDITNFIVSGYGMSGCEEVLQAMFPIGASAEATNVGRTVREVLQSGVPYCFDYEDFNSQHSSFSMAAVLEAYKDVYKDKLEDDQLTAIDWTIQSLFKSSIIINNVRHQISGTLLSGWRLTTFMNTALNYIYTQACMGGKTLVATYNGDDILAGVRTLKQVQQLIKGAKQYQVRFQHSKCFLGAIAEFLRVDHKRGATGAQYLSRAVATFVHGPTESVVPNDLLALLASMQSRRVEMKQRGADPDVVDSFLGLQLQYTSTIWGCDMSDLDAVLTTHRSLGGLSDDISTKTLCHSVERILISCKTRSKKTVTTQAIAEYRKKVSHGVNDFTDRVVRKFQLERYRQVIRRAAQNAIIDRLAARKFGVKVCNHTPDIHSQHQARQYGMLRHEFTGAKVNICKTYNIPLAAITYEDNNLVDLIKGAADPLKAISLWL